MKFCNDNDDNDYDDEKGRADDGGDYYYYYHGVCSQSMASFLKWLMGFEQSTERLNTSLDSLTNHIALYFIAKPSLKNSLW